MPESIAYNFKKILLTTIGIGLFVVIGIYTVMKMKDVIWGVQVTVRGVIDGETVTEPKITLEGNARNIEVLTINDRVVGVSEDGEFRDSLILSPGYNIVSIKGDDKFGYRSEFINMARLAKNMSQGRPVNLGVPRGIE